MDFLHQIKTSLVFYWRAYSFVDAHDLYRLLILPAIITLFITTIIVVLAIRTSGIISNEFLTHLQFNNQDKDSLKIIEGLLIITIRAIVFFLYLKIYRFLILFLLAPVFASISNKIQTIATGKIRKPCTRMYLIDCSRGMKIALRNFLLEVIISTIIILVALITPWLIPIAPLLVLGVESYFTGYALTDYRNEHFGLSEKKSRKLMHQYLGLIIGNGLFFNILLLIPIIGTLLTPAFALIASGLAIDHLEKRKQILCSSDQSTLMMEKS